MRIGGVRRPEWFSASVEAINQPGVSTSSLSALPKQTSQLITQPRTETRFREIIADEGFRNLIVMNDVLSDNPVDSRMRLSLTLYGGRACWIRKS